MSTPTLTSTLVAVDTVHDTAFSRKICSGFVELRNFLMEQIPILIQSFISEKEQSEHSIAFIITES